jgi:hypothetical protein
MRRFVFSNAFVILPLTIFLVACGGSSKSGDDTLMDEINGKVIKGPVVGATINIFIFNSDGTTGNLVEGPIISGDDGEWSTQIPPSIKRPLLVVSSGGIYTDEASGNLVTAGEINSLLVEGSDSIAVTPLTELLVEVTREYLSSNPASNLNDALDVARATLANIISLNFDPLIVLPSNPENTSGGNAEQNTYAAVLAGLSQLAENVAPAEDPFVVIQALVSDMKDGVLNSQNGDIAITMNESTLDLGSNTLIDSINTYIFETGNFQNVEIYSVSLGDIGPNGTVSPATTLVRNGGTAEFTVSPDFSYELATVSGCNGTLNSSIYTTGVITSDCSISATFQRIVSQPNTATWNQFNWNQANWQ